MKNVKPRFIDAPVYKGPFITNYRFIKSINKIKVSYHKDTPSFEKPTQGNYDIIDSRLLAQSDFLSGKPLNGIKLERALDILGTAISLALAGVFIFAKLPINEKFQNIMAYVTGGLSILGIVITERDYEKIADIVKHKIFFEEKDTLVEDIKETKNSLRGTSLLTKLTLSKEELSSQNIGRIPYLDLLKIRRNIAVQKEMQYDPSEPIDSQSQKLTIK